MHTDENYNELTEVDIDEVGEKYRSGEMKVFDAKLFQIHKDALLSLLEESARLAHTLKSFAWDYDEEGTADDIKLRLKQALKQLGMVATFQHQQ